MTSQKDMFENDTDDTDYVKEETIDMFFEKP